METETELQELATELVEENITPSWLDWYVILNRQTTASDWKHRFDKIVENTDDKCRTTLAKQLKQFFDKYRRRQDLRDT